jgi:VIT1/CCC1 family predicted Fe2+/Mn2+ transporter
VPQGAVANARGSTTSPQEIQRYRANLDDELNGAALYRALATAETDSKIAELYERLARVEERHARTWADHLRAAGVAPMPFRPSWRTRALGALARRFGVRAVLPTIATLEDIDSHTYSQQPDAAGLVPDERSHARLLRQITQALPSGLPGSAIAQIEGRHAAGGGNALRAAVLGASDGLLSNFGLVMGVAGADLTGRNILITGIAGLLAGASSMALGEWLSVQSSRELYEHQLNVERREIVEVPQEEAEELSLIYQSRGVAEARARELASQVMTNQGSAIEVLAREELGIDAKELGGSAWVAAATSFVMFAVGAVVPVLPFSLLSGTGAVAASALLSAAGLFIIGAAVTLFTGRSLWFSGARQLLFGLVAAAITYAAGRLIGGALAP